jgi:hypothetical protein
MQSPNPAHPELVEGPSSSLAAAQAAKKKAVLRQAQDGRQFGKREIEV